jgi:hypothetical protein
MFTEVFIDQRFIISNRTISCERTKNTDFVEEHLPSIEYSCLWKGQCNHKRSIISIGFNVKLWPVMINISNFQTNKWKNMSTWHGCLYFQLHNSRTVKGIPVIAKIKHYLCFSCQKINCSQTCLMGPSKGTVKYGHIRLMVV